MPNPSKSNELNVEKYDEDEEENDEHSVVANDAGHKEHSPPFHTASDFPSSKNERIHFVMQQLEQNNVAHRGEEGHVFAIQIDQEGPEGVSAWSKRMSRYIGGYTGKTYVYKVVSGNAIEEIGGPYTSASHPHWRGGGIIPYCKDNGFCSKKTTKKCTSDNQCNNVGYKSVDGDGSYELARLPPGPYIYKAKYRPSCKKKRSVVEGSARGITVAGCFAMKSHRVKTFRDLNHDGKIDLKEMEKKYTATGILLHSGYQSQENYDKCCREYKSGSNRRKRRCSSICKKKGPSSAGCQTFPPTDWNKFAETIKKATGQEGYFSYVLFYRPNVDVVY
eukprot:g16125.t1